MNLKFFLSSKGQQSRKIGQYQPKVSKHAIRHVKAVIQKNTLIYGEYTKALSNALQRRHNALITLTSNGTQALATIFRLLMRRVGKMDSPLTFNVAVPANYHLADLVCLDGGVPTWVDTDEYGNMDYESLIKLDPKSLDAVLYIAVGGNKTLSYNRISEWCYTNDVPLVVDACHSFGIEYKCDFAVVSFYPTKVMFGASGGAILFYPSWRRNDKLNLAWMKDELFQVVNLKSWLGTNCRMDEIQASIIYANLQEYDKWLAHRKLIARMYHTVVSNLFGSKLVWTYSESEITETNFYKYMLVFKSKEDKDRLETYLRDNDVFIPDIVFDYKFPCGSLSEIKYISAYRFCGSHLSLPCHQFMTIKEASKIVKLLRRYKYGRQI